MKKGKIILIVIALFILVPIVIGYVFLNTGETLEVTWNEADFTSGLEKSNVQISNIQDINMEALVRKAFSTSGTVEVETHFTNEEMSALIASANDEVGPLKNFKVSFEGEGNGAVRFQLSERFTDFLQESLILEGGNIPFMQLGNERFLMGVQASSTLTEFVVDYITNAANNKPVYATGSLSRAGNQSIRANIDTLYVGRIPMNDYVIQRVEDEVERIANAIITEENGFYIEELRVENGQLYFKGTLPAEIHGIRMSMKTN